METFNDVISGEGIVLVDFYAVWCQPCKMMHPVLEHVKAVLGDKIRIIKIDVDKHSDIAAVYGIRSVPTLMLFKRNEVLYRQSGAMSKADILSLLEPFFMS
ncbi:MAG: thioredoxin [Bacteroides sp.]|nr:thioredoxin [Roseburia sp.]MCM1347065.1 thioredoxin [Bacteroides sp.]MCM1420650.1 thioredoxin [Bacteroides sp.]